MAYGVSKEESMCLLQINAALIEKLVSMQRAGEPADVMLQTLRMADVPKPGASLALRLSDVLPLEEAREAVEQSAAYSTWPDVYAEAAAEGSTASQQEAA